MPVAWREGREDGSEGRKIKGRREEERKRKTGREKRAKRKSKGWEGERMGDGRKKNEEWLPGLGEPRAS